MGQTCHQLRQCGDAQPHPLFVYLLAYLVCLCLCASMCVCVYVFVCGCLVCVGFAFDALGCADSSPSRMNGDSVYEEPPKLFSSTGKCPQFQ